MPTIAYPRQQSSLNEMKVLFFCLIMSFANQGLATEWEKLGLTLNSKVVFGISTEDLTSMQPRLTKISVKLAGDFNESQSEFNLVGVNRSSGLVRVETYHMAANKLRGLTMSMKFIDADKQDVRSYVTQIVSNLRRDFRFLGKEQTLRTDGAMAFAVTAQKWESADKVTSIYFVATSRDVSLIFFDPLYLSRQRLMPNISQKSKFDLSFESARKRQNGNDRGDVKTKIEDYLAELNLLEKEKSGRKNTSVKTQIPSDKRFITDRPNDVRIEKTEAYTAFLWPILGTATLVVGWLVLRKYKKGKRKLEMNPHANQ